MTYATTHRAGIYMIRNSVTGDAYYGSAVDLRRRSQTHASALRNGRHGNARLQHSWNKHGEAAFTFAVLAVLEREDLLATESRLLAAHAGRPDCYNIAPVAAAPMAGRKHTPESKARIVEYLTGRSPSDATRAKMSEWQKGVKRPDAPNGKRGWVAPPEVRARISEAARNRKYTDEGRAKRSASSSAAMTPERRAQVSATLKGRAFAPEHRAKINETKYLRRALRLFAANYVPQAVAA